MPEVAIHVCDRHIAQGGRDQCLYCPVALAINEHLRPGLAAFATLVYVSILHRGEDEKWLWKRAADAIPLPQDVRGAIDRFDVTGTMEPFEFCLNIPAECLKETPHA